MITVTTPKRKKIPENFLPARGRTKTANSSEKAIAAQANDRPDAACFRRPRLSDTLSSMADLSDLLADLNEPQRQAVSHRDGPLLVLAGPGSGKTRVITRRAAAIVRSGVAPRHVLAITFTNKAAAEMRHRIEALGVARGMWICTFHSLCVRLLREFGPAVGVMPGFTIYDAADQRRCIKEAMEAAHIEAHLMEPDRIADAISDAKSKLETWQKRTDAAANLDDRIIAHVYREYDGLLRRRNAVDFDDLLMKMAMLLRDDEALRARLNDRFWYVLIDEYQDTNLAQYTLAHYLSAIHRNICATGDPDQSIYGWRGADISNILDFEHDYADATVVRLEQNYRSTGSILAVASALIDQNKRRKRKTLWTEGAAGDPVRVWEFSEGRDEAERIAQTIAASIADGRNPSEFAIFYRVNAISRGLEEALRANRVPYRIARGVEFYNRREIKDALAYLRVLVNPADEVSLLRIINTPARGIGKTTLDRLVRLAAMLGKPVIEALREAPGRAEFKSAGRKLAAFVDLLEDLQPAPDMGVTEIVKHVLERSGLEKALAAESGPDEEDRVENVRELVSAAARFETDDPEPTLEGFLAHVSLTSDQDAVDENAGAVMMMTLHAAKGLEFPVVFLVGLEQGLLPHERAFTERGDLEEERRLCFVGVTRAREQLYLTHVRERFLRGQFMPRAQSQFLLELGEEGVEFESFRVRSAPSVGAWNARRSDDDLEDRDPDAIDDEADDSFDTAEFERPRKPKLRVVNVDDDLPAISINQPTGRNKAASDGDARPVWHAQMFIEHTTYGVGQIVWVRPGMGETRAAIRFPGYGERVFVLEKSPIRRLDRKPAD